MLQALNENRKAGRDMLCKFCHKPTLQCNQIPMTLAHSETYQKLEIMKHKPQSKTRSMHVQIHPKYRIYSIVSRR